MNKKNILGYIIAAALGAGICFFSNCSESSNSNASFQKNEIQSIEAEFADDTSGITELHEKAFGPMPEDSANERVKAYRKRFLGPLKTMVIWHEAAEIKNYVDSIFLKYTPLIQLPDTLMWKLAFSPMYVKKLEKKRLTLCVLPCLVNRNDSTVYDFFEEKKNKTELYTTYYSKLYKSIKSYKFRGKLLTDPGFIFDEGQLWP